MFTLITWICLCDWMLLTFENGGHFLVVPGWWMLSREALNGWKERILCLVFLNIDILNWSFPGSLSIIIVVTNQLLGTWLCYSILQTIHHLNFLFSIHSPLGHFLKHWAIGWIICCRSSIGMMRHPFLCVITPVFIMLRHNIFILLVKLINFCFHICFWVGISVSAIFSLLKRRAIISRSHETGAIQRSKWRCSTLVWNGAHAPILGSAHGWRKSVIWLSSCLTHVLNHVLCVEISFHFNALLIF